MIRPLVRTLTATAVVCLAAQAAAQLPPQSLADVARREEARRGSVGKPSKAYTNADLTRDFTEPAPAAVPDPPATAPQPAAATNASASQASAAPPAYSGPPKPSPQDEQRWRRRAADARAAIDKARALVAPLLKAEPHPDPREQERTAALLKKYQDSLARAEQNYALLLQQADAALVPKAWVEPPQQQ